MSYKRRVVRERVLQALYAYEISGEPIERIIDEIVTLKSQREALAFAKELIHTVIEHQEEIDSTIKKKVANWEFNRIAVIDRILLEMGICELLYFEDIPPKVTINEAIEIAKRYSTEKSGQFINGVLDSLFADLKTNGKLRKSGRGLVDTTLHPKEKSSGTSET
ncbi:MAG: transcription antitermination factor NusB [Bacteroidota bacterium]